VEDHAALQAVRKPSKKALVAPPRLHRGWHDPVLRLYLGVLDNERRLGGAADAAKRALLAGKVVYLVLLVAAGANQVRALALRDAGRY